MVEDQLQQTVIFPPWEEVHDLAEQIIRRQLDRYRPKDRIDQATFVRVVLSTSFIYFMSPKRRRKFRGDMEGWLKGNVCLSAAKDDRARILGRTIAEDGKDRSEWIRRDPATGLPGRSIPIEQNVGGAKKPVWQVIDLQEPPRDEHKEIMPEVVRDCVIDGGYLIGGVSPHYWHVKNCPDCRDLFKKASDLVMSGQFDKDHPEEVKAIVKEYKCEWRIAHPDVIDDADWIWENQVAWAETMDRLYAQYLANELSPCDWHPDLRRRIEFEKCLADG
jgi:hypothetical protein